MNANIKTLDEKKIDGIKYYIGARPVRINKDTVFAMKAKRIKQIEPVAQSTTVEPVTPTTNMSYVAPIASVENTVSYVAPNTPIITSVPGEGIASTMSAPVDSVVQVEPTLQSPIMPAETQLPSGIEPLGYGLPEMPVMESRATVENKEQYNFDQTPQMDTVDSDITPVTDDAGKTLDTPEKVIENSTEMEVAPTEETSKDNEVTIDKLLMERIETIIAPLKDELVVLREKSERSDAELQSIKAELQSIKAEPKQHFDEINRTVLGASQKLEQAMQSNVQQEYEPSIPFQRAA